MGNVRAKCTEAMMQSRIWGTQQHPAPCLQWELCTCHPSPFFSRGKRTEGGMVLAAAACFRVKALPEAPGSPVLPLLGAVWEVQPESMCAGERNACPRLCEFRINQEGVLYQKSMICLLLYSPAHVSHWVQDKKAHIYFTLV